MSSAADQLMWWEKPYRIVQTNLRLTDVNLDPEKLARQVRQFGATALTFNVGGIFAFYPTELPLQARNPFASRDLTADMLKAAHREALKMIGRYDLSKGTRIAYEAHPDWFVHNADGEPQEYNGTYQACVNGGWSLDYAHQILKESLSTYPLDGVFFNMTGYQPYDYSGKYHGICHCRNCRDGFRDQFSRDLPSREDSSDPAFADYLEFKRRTSWAASQKIYETVKMLRPNTGVMGNGRGSCDFMRLEIQRAVNRPAPEWPHQAGELARWAEAVGTGKPYSCASTNFLDYQWRFASETPHNHMLRFGQQIASGAQVDYYLLGTFEQENSAPLQPVRNFMKWHEANEEHLWNTKSLAKVALYHSRAADQHAGATASGKQRLGCFRGAYRLLLEGRIPFDFLSDERMGDNDIHERLSAYDVILLPNTACLSAQEAEALDTFVAQGGTLIATGESALYDERGKARGRFVLESLPVHRVNHAVDRLETYVSIREDELDFPETRLLHLDGWYFYVDKKEDAEGLLTLLPRAAYGPPELCFPELKVDANRGIYSRSFGRGRAFYVPWLPEWLYLRDGLPEHRELFVQLIQHASKSPAKLMGAGPLELTLRTKSDGSGDRIAHVVNYAGQRHSAYEEPPPIGGLRMGVLGVHGSARSLVDGKTMEISPPDLDGYSWIELPDVKYFEVILLPASTS